MFAIGGTTDLSYLVSHYRFFTILTFMALAIKALVPAGYMLNVGANGETIITLCAPDGGRDVYFDPVTNSVREIPDSNHSSDGVDHASQVCPFSALLAAALAAPAGNDLSAMDPTSGRTMPVASGPIISRFLLGQASPRAPPRSSFF